MSAASCGVVVVTFGEMAGAALWLKETNCPFPYYQDPTRALYQNFGLKRSIKQVWNTETLNFYGSEAAKGTVIPEGYSNIKDDPHQMGGDFIVYKDFKLKFVYRCKTPSDRPSVDQVLKVLSHGSQVQD